MMSAQLQQASAASNSRGQGKDEAATFSSSAANAPPSPIAQAQAQDATGGSSTQQQQQLRPMRSRAGESYSPYVQLHRDTPVAWQLLDDKAVAMARRENKLIFMNIGFKACHYCRLTTQDSFSNPAVAALLNTSFVPVIVDREERPDVDAIYMNYIQAVNSAGGWPLNLFLTPELQPVFGGTYWPGPGTDNGNGGGGESSGGGRAVSGGGSGRDGSGKDEEEEERLDFLVVLKKLQKVWAEQEVKCRREAAQIVEQLREFAAEGTLGTRRDAAATTHSAAVPDPAAPAPPVAAATPTSSAAGVTAPPSLAHPHPHPPAPTFPATTIASSTASPANDLDVDLDQLEEAYSNIAKTFDHINGGFNLAPKFPTPPKLSFLLRLARFPPAVADVVGHREVEHAAHMALHTLRRVRDGGLRDHVGGGFARYSATDDWSVPHFEKMVVDNALLLGVYLDAWLCTTPTAGDGGGDAKPKADDEFADVVLELADYLTSPPVRTPQGLFASSEASDSFYRRGDRHMREGAYYLWTRREFDATVAGGPGPGPAAAADAGGFVVEDQQAARVAAAHWNVLEHGNVDRELDPHDEFINQNVLRVVKDAAELSASFGIPVDGVRRILAAAKARLRARREAERVRPEVDDKAVVAYNGMVVRSLARTGAVLRELGIDAERGDRYVLAAEGAVGEIKKSMWDEGKKLLYRTSRGGVRGEMEALAEDYAFLVEGLLDLFEATGKESYLKWADELQDRQISLFYDHIAPAHDDPTTATAATPHRSSSGGFYSTVEGAPQAILRLKDGMDTTQPSTNAVSAANLFRLSVLLGGKGSGGGGGGGSWQPRSYGALARETIKAFEVETLQYPWLFTGLLTSVVTARLGWLSFADGPGEEGRMARRGFFASPRAGLRVLVSPSSSSSTGEEGEATLGARMERLDIGGSGDAPMGKSHVA